MHSGIAFLVKLERSALFYQLQNDQIVLMQCRCWSFDIASEDVDSYTNLSTKFRSIHGYLSSQK